MTGKAVGSLNDACTHVRSGTRHDGRHTYTRYARAHYACACAWFKCVNPGYVYNWFMLIERNRKELLGTLARNDDQPDENKKEIFFGTDIARLQPSAMPYNFTRVFYIHLHCRSVRWNASRFLAPRFVQSGYFTWYLSHYSISNIL